MGEIVTDAVRAHGSPLRVGILLDSFDQPRWIARALELLWADGHCVPTVVVLNGTMPTETSRVRAWIRNRNRLLYALYERLDSRRFARPDDALQGTRLDALLAGVPTMTVTPRSTKFVDYFSDEDLARLRAYELDVVIRLGFRIVRGDILKIARFGVWSYHHGDNAAYRGGPAGFWEVMHDDPITGCVLQVLSDELDGGRIIYRSYGATERLSVRKSRAAYYQKSSAFLARAMRDLHESRSLDGMGPPLDRCRPSAYSRPIFTAPTNVTMGRLLMRLIGRYARQRLGSFTHEEQWCIAYRVAPTGEPDAPVPDLVPHRFRPLIPPRDRFWADPFPLTVDGRHWVFFEEFIRERGRGHISVVEVTKSGPVGAVTPVIECDHHLAYPFVFEWNGAYYLIPESISAGVVRIYRAVEFPFRWELDRELMMDVVAVDPTIAHINGQWWMFANTDAGGSSTMDELNLYYADSPLGPWTPHPRNPVVSDVRSSRPAGRLFQSGGRWFRPSQDSSGRYGRAIVINRILRLDRQTYEETPVTRIEPEWMPGLTGTHTINASRGITVIDGRLRRSRY